MSGTKSLDGIHVVVDAYNLDLPEGTGIKTYGSTLIAALRALGAEVGVLHARPAARRRGTGPLNTVLFFDQTGINHGSSGRHRRVIDAGMVALRQLLRWPCKVYDVRLSNECVLPPITEKQFQGVLRYNFPDCYRTALSSFHLTGRDLLLRIPNRVDLWHTTYPLPVSVKGAKKITTIHDCIPFRLPYTTLDNKERLYKLYRHAIRTSDLILTVSENSKTDIVTLFDVDPEKIQVTYQPVPLQSLSNDERASLPRFLAARFNLDIDGYILFVGAIEPKKNVKTLVDAFLEIDTYLPLIIVGKKAWLWESQIGNLDGMGALKNGRVRVFDHVPSNDLRYLYAGAHCFVFPSLYEGFGLPPLEAMTFGVPVVTANVSSLPEVCGDAALYVDPYDTESIRSGIEKVLADEDVRRRLQVAGKKRVHAFRPEVYVKRLYEVYSAIL